MRNHPRKPEDLVLQNATSLRKSISGPPPIHDEDVSYPAPATQSASLQRLFKCPTRAIVFKMLQNPRVKLAFVKVQNPLPLQEKRRCNVQSGLNLVFLRFAFRMSHHNGMHFFDIWTS